MTLKRIIPSFFLAVALFVSCQDIYDRLDTLEASVSNLKTVTEYIQTVVRENKIVKEVIRNGEDYTLLFTDGSSVNIVNSKDEKGKPVQSISTDKSSVTIVLSDGSVYIIPMYHTVPSGIIVYQKELLLPKGGEASLQLRVNPSNAAFSEDEVSIDYSGKNFELASFVPEADKSGKLIPGRYIATFQDLSISDDYNESVALVIRTKDSYGEEVQVWSEPLLVRPAMFNGISTGLPIVSLTTPGKAPIISKLEWMEGAEVVVYNPDLSIDYQGTLSVKGRGNSTWTQFPKKPYAMKLDAKSKILGMNKSKRWCLLANYMDRTLIRNAVAFEVSRKTGLEWTPSGRFVELFLNGEHLGNYYLCEQIKVEETKVNLKDGYLFECDAWFDEEFKFRSAIANVPWQFKDPDVVDSTQFLAVQAFVNEFESSLYDDAKFAERDYLNYIEPESFVDWWIVNEICQNSEVNQPKSSYVHMEKGGKLVAGPVWDFDWGTFLVKDRYNYVSMGDKYYISRLFKDPQFRKLIKTRWASYKDKLFNDIPTFIDELGASLAASDDINHEMWPINRTTNQDESLGYAEAVAKLKTSYLGKLQWLDSSISTF